MLIPFLPQPQPHNHANLNLQLDQFKRTQSLSPNFDRQGRTVRGLGYWISALLYLGGDSAKAGLYRWLTLAALVAGYKKIQEHRSGLPSYLK
jgi:beta-apo-4'-carotenal oxygenase